MRKIALLVIVSTLGVAAALGVLLATVGGSDTSPQRAAIVLAPTSTWEPHCELGPPPDDWESWEAFLEYGKSVIATHGPPPTPERMTPDPELFERIPPPGYDSMEDYIEHMVALRQEIDGSGAKARANCTGEEVCIETSVGPTCVAPAGEVGRLCLGDGCPTKDVWRP